MPKTGHPRARSAALLAACTLFAAAAAPAPARAEVNEVRIGVQFGLIYLPVVVAEAQGFFAEEAKKAGLPDLKVSVQRFSGSPAITDAVLSGNVDVGAFGTPGLLIAWEKTKGHQEVAGLAALGANAFILETNKPQIKSRCRPRPRRRRWSCGWRQNRRLATTAVSTSFWSACRIRMRPRRSSPGR